MQELENKKAFVLHSRPFKENQVIAELLVQEHGRIAVVGYKGSKKNSAKTALYNPFRMLQVQFKTGKGLHAVKGMEAVTTELQLKGKMLFCGFYLNELICRLCQADAPYETLFNHYFSSIKQLESITEISDELLQQAAMELVLRRFEDALLAMLGYEINFIVTIDTELPIEPHLQYELFEGGFVHTNSLNRGFLGSDILGVMSLLREEVDEGQHGSRLHYLKHAKAILRASLHRHLGDKPLKSRELFRK